MQCNKGWTQNKRKGGGQLTRGKISNGEKESALGRKELVPLKHLVKLRKSSLQMILPDIQKCSKSDHSMGDNRYCVLCVWHCLFRELCELRCVALMTLHRFKAPYVKMGTVCVSTNMYWRWVSQRRTPVGGNNRKKKKFCQWGTKTKKWKWKSLKRKIGKEKLRRVANSRWGK